MLYLYNVKNGAVIILLGKYNYLFRHIQYAHLWNNRAWEWHTHVYILFIAILINRASMSFND